MAAWLDRVRSALGWKPPEQLAGGKPRRDEIIVGDLPLYQQFQRIGGNLTPQLVSGIIQEADTGYIWRLIDLANESRQKDCHLHGILQTREIGLSSTAWEISPYVKRGRKEPKARDRNIAEWMEDTVLAVRGGPVIDAGADPRLSGFNALVAHMAGAAYYGFAVAEVVWGKVGGYLVPIGFNLIAPRRFMFDQKDGRLKWNDVGFPRPIDVLDEFPAGKFIVHQPRIIGDVPAREGLLRPLIWAALFRNWTIRDWLSLAELAWKPWRTGVYKKGAGKEDIDNLYKALQRLSNNGVAAFPETTELKVEWPKSAVSSGQSMHGELALFLGGEMSKAVLGQTLTTEAGARGARSLGDVHDNIRKDIAVWDAMCTSATLMGMLFTPMVRMNFGATPDVAQFAFVTETKENTESFSKGILNLKTAGTRIPAKWVRERVGMPEPEEDDELLEAATPDPNGPDPNPGDDAPDDGAGAGDDPAQPDQESDATAAA